MSAIDLILRYGRQGVPPTFQRDFAGVKTLDHGTGPAITFTRASNATFFDANGTLQTAANDTPRFDHSGGSSLGLFIEEARTNSIRNSQAGGSTNGVIGSGGVLPTNWLVVNSVGTSCEVVGTGSENGMNYVDIRFTGTPANTSPNSVSFEGSTQVAALQNQTWTTSASVALVGGTLTNVTSVGIGHIEVNSGGTALASGVITSFTPTTTLTRYVGTRTLTNASTAFYRPNVRFNPVNTVDPIDFTLRIAAPQLEQGAFATSYIPTTTAAATRAADSAVVTPISSFYNQAEGTVVAHYSRSSVQAAGNQIPWMFSDNSGDNIACVTDSASGAGDRALIVAGGGSQMNTGSINYSANQQIARALGMKADDCATSANGASVVTDSTVTLPSVDRLTIGFAPYFSSSRLNGHIRKLAYWPKRLSNTLLQQLTT
jgi:hypothetical protein